MALLRQRPRNDRVPPWRQRRFVRQPSGATQSPHIVRTGAPNLALSGPEQQNGLRVTHGRNRCHRSLSRLWVSKISAGPFVKADPWLCALTRGSHALLGWPCRGVASARHFLTAHHAVGPSRDSFFPDEWHTACLLLGRPRPVNSTGAPGCSVCTISRQPQTTTASSIGMRLPAETILSPTIGGR
jgi:hypothetical protein